MGDRQIIPTWVVFLAAGLIVLAWGNDPSSPLLAFLAGVQVTLIAVFLYLKHALRRLEASHD